MRLIAVCSLAIALLFSGCGSDPKKEASTSKPKYHATASTSTGGWDDPNRRARGYGEPSLVRASYQGGSSGQTLVTGPYAGYPAVERFIARMERQGFSRAELVSIISRVEKQSWAINYYNRPRSSRKSTGPNGAWTRYRAKFITSKNLSNGAAFWRRYADVLARAERKYGVSPAVIVGIIGVETKWGGHTGKSRIVDALVSLAFDVPRRSKFFTDELEAFLLMSREEGFDPFQPRGSFAGAMGLGQFMPSSFRNYAVDFNGDGKRDLWNPVDAIGSVANYFKGHGWKSGGTVAVRATATQPTARSIEAGFKTRYAVGSLETRGVEPRSPVGSSKQVSLLRLDVGSGYQYWLGFRNFYVITRYNHSTHYAMAVWKLGEAIKARAAPGRTRPS